MSGSGTMFDEKRHQRIGTELIREAARIDGEMELLNMRIATALGEAPFVVGHVMLATDRLASRAKELSKSARQLVKLSTPARYGRRKPRRAKGPRKTR